MAPVPVDLSKLSDLVRNDVVKKTEYDDARILVKKADINTKINEIQKKITNHDHGKYINTQEFIRLMPNHFADKLKQANLIKNAIADFAENIGFDEKFKNCNKNITSNKANHVLIQIKLNKLSEKVKLYQQKI